MSGLGVLSGKCVVPKGVVFWIAVRDGARSYLRRSPRNVHKWLLTLTYLQTNTYYARRDENYQEY